jgi:transcriptional regulator with XRE-family HTH domain
MPGDPKVLFGRRLAALRHAKGWSLEDLAGESGISWRYISDVERGYRNIGLVNICRLARALGVAPSKLMSFDQPDR